MQLLWPTSYRGFKRWSTADVIMIINKKTSYRLLSYGLVVKEEIIKVKAESSKLQPL
jgi:hypothetical protein